MEAHLTVDDEKVKLVFVKMIDRFADENGRFDIEECFILSVLSQKLGLNDVLDNWIPKH